MLRLTALMRGWGVGGEGGREVSSPLSSGVALGGLVNSEGGDGV